MKKQLTALMLAFGVMMSFGTFAQEAELPQKIGHINADQLLQMMPETKSAQEQLQAYGQQLEKDLAEMEKELQTKTQTFRQNQDVMTTLSRDTKIRELQELQGRIQEYSMKAQEDLQNKQVELLTPIIEKATNAVQKVADDNNFSYILDSSESKAVVIFAGNGVDIMPMVKQELGLQ